MASAILSELRPFVFINLSGPPFIFNIFFILVNGLVGADKMSLCTSFRRVNSALPLATSRPAGATFPPPPQVRDFTRHTYRLAILSPNSAPEADRLSNNSNNRVELSPEVPGTMFRGQPPRLLVLERRKVATSNPRGPKAENVDLRPTAASPSRHPYENQCNE